MSVVADQVAALAGRWMRNGSDLAPIGCGVVRSPPILPDVIGNEFGNVLDRAQRGDESAVACLWYDINPTLKRYLRVIAGEVNEDVVSRTRGLWAGG